MLNDNRRSYTHLRRPPKTRLGVLAKLKEIGSLITFAYNVPPELLCCAGCVLNLVTAICGRLPAAPGLVAR